MSHPPSPERDTRTEFMPQLEGLREVAILGVLWAHNMPAWCPVQLGILAGRSGVLLFFVLSAFLITGILLRAKEAGKPGAVLKAFYARRALRIFPVYYLTLGVVWCFGYPPMVKYLLWHFFYLSNIAAARGLDLGMTGHFWSLSVEEQFYLIWPVLILFVPKRLITAAIGGVLIVGLLYRTAGVLLHWNWFALVWTLPGTVDALALGALLAVFVHRGNRAHRRLLMWACICGAALLTAVELSRGPVDYLGVPVWPPYPVLHVLLLSLALLPLVDLASRGKMPFLEWKPLRFIGRISYAVYLFQTLLLLVLPRSFFLLTTASMLLATVTWVLIEKPFNNLKSRFPYPAKPAA